MSGNLEDQAATKHFELSATCSIVGNTASFRFHQVGGGIILRRSVSCHIFIRIWKCILAHRSEVELADLRVCRLSAVGAIHENVAWRDRANLGDQWLNQIVTLCCIILSVSACLTLNCGWLLEGRGMREGIWHQHSTHSAQVYSRRT